MEELSRQDKITLFIMGLLTAWVGFSMVDVFIHQLTGGTTSFWNLFVIFLKAVGAM